MKEFAKLFKVGERQLLVYIEADTDSDEDDKTLVHQITNLDGAMLDITIGGPDHAMQKVFTAYDGLTAGNFFCIGIVKKTIKTFMEAEDE